jgi:hypothetical protein
MENCKGCLYYDNKETLKSFRCIFSGVGYSVDSIKIKGCPCRICLVKVICNRRCEDFMIYFKTFDKDNTRIEWDKYYLRDGLIVKQSRE